MYVVIIKYYGIGWENVPVLKIFLYSALPLIPFILDKLIVIIPSFYLLLLNLLLSFIGIILIIFSISFLGVNDKLVKSLFGITS